MSTAQTPEITASGRPATACDTDWLVVPVLNVEELERDPLFADLDRAADGAITRAREAGEFRAERRQTFVATLTDRAWQARRVALVGTGGDDRALADRLREAASIGARLARTRRVTRMAVVCRGDGPAARLGQALAEGAGAGAFVDRRYKTDRDTAFAPPACDIVDVAGGPSELAEGVTRGAAVARATNMAREFANDPANQLTPVQFAEQAAAAGRAAGLGVEILDAASIERLGMGLLLGVSQGSQEPPRLLVLEHTPPTAPAAPVLGLVGKGVTFDSGGISIKPSAGMEQMKGDMAGGAAVIGAMCAIAAVGAPRRVIGIVPMTENMPSGTATRPGDILTGASGTTVEVINTDAEGRLILGDALWYARERGATHLVDVATLTGACVIALGKAASGLFGRPDRWRDLVAEAAARAGERVWPLPMYQEYREQLDSEMADLKNTGGRPAGASTAAAFVGAFAGDLPWAHLDIAGTAWLDEAGAAAASGATGVMVRTFVELASTDGTW